MITSKLFKKLYFNTRKNKKGKSPIECWIFFRNGCISFWFYCVLKSFRFGKN